MKKVLFGIILLVGFILPVKAEELYELIPVDKHATVETENFIYKDFYDLYDDGDLIHLFFCVQKILIFLLSFYYQVDMFFSFVPPPDINLHYYNNKIVDLSMKTSFLN